jgi:hypothetical protein
MGAGKKVGVVFFQFLINSEIMESPGGLLEVRKPCTIAL